MKQSFKNESLNVWATLCMQNEKTISIAGKIQAFCQLRYFRLRCRSRSHKRSKCTSKCGPRLTHLAPEEQLKDISIV